MHKIEYCNKVFPFFTWCYAFLFFCSVPESSPPLPISSQYLPFDLVPVFGVWLWSPASEDPQKITIWQHYLAPGLISELIPFHLLLGYGLLCILDFHVALLIWYLSFCDFCTYDTLMISPIPVGLLHCD